MNDYDDYGLDYFNEIYVCILYAVLIINTFFVLTFIQQKKKKTVDRCTIRILR